MARDVDLLLADIVAAVRDAIRYAAGLTPEEFLLLPVSDRDRYRALKNALTELGEAVKGLPDDTKAASPGIGWQGLAGLRDIIAHQYFRIDMERLWPVLSEELPKTLPALERMLATVLPPDDEPNSPIFK